ncbi:hypothetical protein [Microbacterium sp. R86528]|uniref:hypothetical protein n=1 Tax=Microbacterium sp. R86528 TaxID=3093864 RepID=UPI0037C9BB4B
MITLIWAFMERMAPRAGTALLMLAFAATSDPTTVGYYAAAMTGYTVLQAVTDGAAKRIATSAVATGDGIEFLRKYRIWYGYGGTLFMLIVLVVVWLWGAPIADVATLTPLLVLPAIMGQTVVPLARLQRAGMWKQVSLLSGSAAAFSLLVGFPLVLTLHNALGSVIQLVLTEAIFAVGVHRIAHSVLGVNAVEKASGANYFSQFRSAGTFIVSMQGQYMLDRLAVGFFGGPAALGAFNLGWSLSRSITDSLSTSTLSVIQSRTIDARQKSPAEIRAVIMGAMPHALAMSAASVGVVWVAARFIAPLILGEEWNTMLAVVPLMSATALPSLCCYCLIPALLYYERMRWATAPRLAGLALSIGVGWAVQYSLAAAVWIALFRELLSMSVMMLGLREVVNLRMVMLPLVSTTIVCGLVLGADAILGAVASN